MFGKIISITKNSALVSIVDDSIFNNDLLNTHVVLEDESKKILGEIEEITKEYIKIIFLGEFVDNVFLGGTLRKPSLDSNIRIINEDELRIITGNSDKSISLGISPIYNGYPMRVNIDDMFSNHAVIFGNSGSGKTYGISRIIQNIFPNSSTIPYKANFFIFDSFGEYISAFKNLNKINEYYNFKVITTDDTNAKENNFELLNIPVCLLTKEDLLNLLDATEFSQIAMIEETLRIVKVIASNDVNSIAYKNHFISKAITTLLYSGQTAEKIRDQVFEMLTIINTDEMNLNTIINGVGYTRKFMNCFDIDSEGKFAELKLLVDYIDDFINDELVVNKLNEDIPYSIENLYDAFNFTLYSEKYLLNEKMYDAAMSLRVRLNQLATGPYSKFFTSDEFITDEKYLSYLLRVNDRKAQIVNINLEDVDDRFARTITKFYARLFMRYTRSLQTRASFPINMVLEEAHRYVVENDDINLFGYNIFERIAKEGRKYGLLLDLITQRPTELNEQVISQCANFLIFKITHPVDLDYITKIVPNMSYEIVEKQKTLQSGTCVAFGKIFKIPMIVKMEKPSPEPESANCEIFNNWMITIEKK